MTDRQWEMFQSLATLPTLHSHQAFVHALWHGNGSGQPGLAADLAEVAYIAANRIYGREERNPRESWEMVRRALGLLEEPSIQQVLICSIQQEARNLVADVLASGTPAEHLIEPEEIFYEMGRDALLAELLRLCSFFRPRELT